MTQYIYNEYLIHVKSEFNLMTIDFLAKIDT